MKILDKVLNTTAGKLRFPWLLLLTLILFVVDLFVPDAIPLVDEILLGLATLIISRIREPVDKETASSETALRADEKTD